MAGEEDEVTKKECPWCTICLVIATLTCHSLVLLGNLAFAQSLTDVGGSTAGWSQVGLDLSSALENELDPLVAEVSSNLTDVIDQILAVKESIDDSIYLIGNITDDTAAAVQALGASSNTLQDAGNAATLACDEQLQVLRDTVKSTATLAMANVSTLLNKFFTFIEPTLIQIGNWLVTFGDQVQATIEGFSKTLDVVQKMMDKIMAQVATSTGKEDMLYNTYTLFDVSSTGYISASDLQEVASLYGITALDGDKARTLVEKYDADGDRQLGYDEYSRFVEDDDIPGAMAVVLRAFAKKLSQVAGNVAAGRMRDEVAAAVVDYITLICAKNETKVSWIATRLTNASLPMEFSADVLKDMAMDIDNPNKMTDIDVGQLLVNWMVYLDADYVAEVLELLAEPSFFVSEGYDLDDQPFVVEQVTKWVTNAEIPEAEVKEEKRSRALLGLLSLEAREELRRRHTIRNAENASWVKEWQEHILKYVNAEAKLRSSLQAQSVQPNQSLLSSAASIEIRSLMPGAARSLVVTRAKVYSAQRRSERAARFEMLTSTSTAEVLFDELFGGTTAGSSAEDPDATRATNSGQPAVPETLEFAQFLSWNATQTANTFQDYCFDYMGDSSATLDSFANQIQAMVKKMSGFLKIMMSYCTERGIKDLENYIKDFANSAASDIVLVIEDKVLAPLEQTCKSGSSFIQKEAAVAKKSEMDLDASVDISSAIPLIVSVLQVLQDALPTVIDDLKYARLEVSAVSETLDSIFTTFSVKGPPIFDDISSLYKVLWTAFYVVFVILTLGILFYGFWAGGYCGGPQATVASTEEYKPPETCRERLSSCCSACCCCITGCASTELCFWSCIILFEVIVLLLFIISILLTFIGGIKTFLVAGCSSVFFLGDASICGGILEILQVFLSTFRGDVKNLASMCSEDGLLTCQLLEGELYFNFWYGVISNVAASVLSFQMIVQSARLHEEVRWRRIAKETYLGGHTS